VLVVGAGSSGVQIADELQRAGRRVYLSVGAHDRPPRAYRNRDFCWWLGVHVGCPASAPGKEHVTIAVSGAHGGHTVDFRELAHRGITLVGLTKAFESGTATFQPDLCDNIRRGMRTTWRCWMPQMPTSRPMAWICRKNLPPASFYLTAVHDFADPLPESRGGGDRHHYLGDRLRRGLQLAQREGF
jgi:choline dehydrogenase-like flavoprotein